ncbi:MAG: hypothetical protein JSR19_00500 [Proteobacteria bacterium]|nr:hypothetical protein [Pseudomonadota bacterium]HQR02918.1 hypothetical protein [Rhodocyclaceae bacterium]
MSAQKNQCVLVMVMRTDSLALMVVVVADFPDEAFQILWSQGITLKDMRLSLVLGIFHIPGGEPGGGMRGIFWLLWKLSFA